MTCKIPTHQIKNPFRPLLIAYSVLSHMLLSLSNDTNPPESKNAYWLLVRSSLTLVIMGSLAIMLSVHVQNNIRQENMSTYKKVYYIDTCKRYEAYSIAVYLHPYPSCLYRRHHEFDSSWWHLQMSAHRMIGPS